jgi:hypothetical protein
MERSQERTWPGPHIASTIAIAVFSGASKWPEVHNMPIVEKRNIMAKEGTSMWVRPKIFSRMRPPLSKASFNLHAGLGTSSC